MLDVLNMHVQDRKFILELYHQNYNYILLSFGICILLMLLPTTFITMLLYLGFIGRHCYGIPSFGICILWVITWNYPPPRMPVTIRIIPFLIGNPYNPSFVTVTGWGVDPKDTLMITKK